MLGVIGGSGVYDIDGLSNTRWVKVDSPFGAMSDDVLIGDFQVGTKAQPVAFLPRHGRGHVVSPTEINFRANIDGLKRLGVTDVISLSAVGSLRDGLSPGTFVLVDQFIDRTFARDKSFFGTGLVAHVSMAHPICARLRSHLHAAATGLGLPVVSGGTYLVMEGPQFSSKAESELYRSWNCDVIGMTNMPEAKLAREAELCYATVAMVTDYDCWHPDHDHVTVEAIIKVLTLNSTHARSLVQAAVPGVTSDKDGAGCSCRKALEHAVMTAPAKRDSAMLEKLSAVAGRVLRSHS